MHLALEVAPPVFESGVQATAIELLHHTVYASATGLAYSWLEKSEAPRVR